MNNVYVRSKTSIKTISITRIILLLPLIIYGFYKNGYYLYTKNYIDFTHMFKPILLCLIGASIGAFVNIVYEYLFKKSKDNFIDILFSSFYIEYGIVLACISSININIYIFASVIFVIFFLTKFLKGRTNIMAIIFIIIYIITIILKNDYIFVNSYELSKNFSLNLFDYFIGRAPGGIACTNTLLLTVSLVGMYLTNNNKTEIPMYAISLYIIPALIYYIITKDNSIVYLFTCNYIFIFSYVGTDSISSPYTSNGKMIYGILLGLMTFGFSFLNPIIAPFITLIIVSFLHILIDKIGNRLIKN